MTIDRESHRPVILVHDSPGQAADDGGVHMVAERNLFRKFVETAIANWAVYILCFVNVTGGKFEGCQASIHGKVKKGFRG